MNKDDILRLAREAFGSLIFVPDEGGLLRFAALVAAQERERCAGICDTVARQYKDDSHGHAAERAAKAIRLDQP